MLFKKVVDENLNVCPACQYHFRVGARTRVGQLCDEGTFEELYANIEPIDSLEFVDKKAYSDRIKAEQFKSKEKDALICGKGFIKGRPMVLAVMDPLQLLIPILEAR